MKYKIILIVPAMALLTMILAISNLTQFAMAFSVFTDNPTNGTINLPSVSVSVDSIGAGHIVGEVTNRGTQPATFMEIIATFYNSQNLVIGTDNTFTNPSTVSPGQANPFDLIFAYNDGMTISQIDHVKLHLDWR
ncbi:MAG: hypothetical protein DLM72_02005 [Candidatus Nitrosopolaris wilkensis]|nr:MAG: hypothetical protein DLM72_02005 [Candidatus Nitrosopolaris wilkensis]